MRMKPTRTVVVLYENDSAQKQAVGFCDELVMRFWENCSFDIYWTSFRDLENNTAAQDSKTKTATADIIVFAAEPTGELPLEVALWMQESLAGRNEREGALVGLFKPGESSVRDCHCRIMAHRHGLDYWTEMPREVFQTIPDSPDWYERRAGQVTSVLDDILRQQTPQPKLWELARPRAQS